MKLLRPQYRRSKLAILPFAVVIVERMREREPLSPTAAAAERNQLCKLSLARKWVAAKFSESNTASASNGKAKHSFAWLNKPAGQQQQPLLLTFSARIAGFVAKNTCPGLIICIYAKYARMKERGKSRETFWKVGEECCGGISFLGLWT